jgi:cell division protein FtsL
MWKNLCMLWRTLKKRGRQMAIWAAALPQRMSTRLSTTLSAKMGATMSASRGATPQNAAPASPRRYMPGAPEIYFRKAIDNSRLVRAVDPVQKREMHLFTATVVICFLMALVYLGQHCSSIEYGYKIEDLRAKRDQLADVNRTLKLEEATLKDPERINALAGEMGLALPAVGQVQRMDEGDTRDSGAPVMARADTLSVISVPN